MIAPMRILGWSLRSIASQLGRAPSTISRELRRNGDGRGAYAGYWAHRDAQCRRRAIRRSCRTSSGPATYGQEKLQCRWSPEQIAHRVRLNYPHATQMRISHHTISTWLAADPRMGGAWSRSLRHHRRRRKCYGIGPRASYIPGRVPFADQPAIAQRRGRLGDGEGDLVVGRGQSGFVATHVDRRSCVGLLPRSRWPRRNSCTRFQRMCGGPSPWIAGVDERPFAVFNGPWGSRSTVPLPMWHGNVGRMRTPTAYYATIFPNQRTAHGSRRTGLRRS